MGDAGTPRTGIRLLDRIRVLRGDSEVEVGTAGPRSLLAVLALRVNTTVSLDELVAALWGETPPRSAESSVYTNISLLRKALEPGRPRGEKPRLLTSTRDGYSLRLPPGAVDVSRFEDAAAEARRRWSAGDFAGALGHCDAAMSEWAGTALGGALGPFAEAERLRLEMLKVDVQELRCAALIETGSPEDATATLSLLTADHPLRERLHELLMLALHRTGRQAEALAVYQHARRQLVDELGIEPGHALRRMHEHVLAGEPSGPPSIVAGLGHATRTVPGQLPHAVSAFTGRADEARQLQGLCAAASDNDSGESVRILTIDGAGGVGKTALAVQVAHQVAGLFPDGQLFLDLRGFDPRFPPMTPEAALACLLRGLGADAEALHGDLAAQEAMYRSLLTGRRMLVLLDNAVSTEQVRPLLPGARGCVAVVTSRNRLTGLAVRDGAVGCALDVLPPQESVELLRRVVGADRVDTNIELANELAACCGHLPLALRIVAERVGGADHVELGDMVDELRVERDRLDPLSVSDDESPAVRTVFSWSYQAPTPDDSRAFRLLGLHPSVEMGVDAAAALLGVEVPAAQRQLHSLVRWHLLEQVARGRYRFHDLLRIYAAECAERDEIETATRRSVELMLDWYLRSAVSAKAVLAPAYQQQVAVEPVDPQRSAMVFGTYEDAITWVRRELTTLIEALMQANDRGFDRITALLAATMGTLCGCTDRWMDLLQVDAIGLAVARRLGDRVTEVRLLHNQGVAYQFLDRNDEAIPYFEAVLDLITARGDQPDKSILSHLATAYAVVGWSKVSMPMLEKALQIARETGNRALEASIMGNFCELLLKQGRPAEAVEHARRCVDLIREVDSHHILGHLLRSCGEVCLRADDAEQAIGYLGEALQLSRTLGHPWGEVCAMHALAEALHRTGKTDGVRQLLTDALAIMQETGYLAVSKSKAARIRQLLTEIS